MVQKMRELQREEELQNEVKVLIFRKKREIQQKVNQQILEANKNAILVKQQRKARQLEEEEKIASYIKEKTDKEAELQAEQK